MNDPKQNPSAQPKAPPALKEVAPPYPATFAIEEEDTDRGWIEFRDQCRRQMQRPMELRLKYGFCRVYKPVLDDAPWRAFATMAEYRAWCAANLPDYLGFKQAKT